MIKNAQITSTMLGREDHGIMTFHIFVKWLMNKPLVA